MLPTSLRDRWLAGDDVAVVAPGLDPRALASDGRRVLLVTPDDLSALLLGVAAGAPLLLRATGARERNRSLSGPAPLLVTSVDALHLPSYRALLAGELSQAPRAAWGVDAFEAFGRLAWIRELLGSCLRVYTSAARAPDGTDVIGGDTGCVRAGERLAIDLVGLGGGVLLGAGPNDASLGGLPLRRHRVDRPLARGWTEAERALRAADAGIDVLEGGATVATAGVGRALAIADGQPFFNEAGGVVLVAPRGPRADVSAADVDAVRDAARRGGSDEDPWVVGDAADPGLLGDLVRSGVLRDLRPVWTEARVADAQRFRRPFVDAHEAWRDLAARYGAALPGWTLAERTRLALSDQAPRDLVALASMLSVRPSMVCDVLMDLDATDLMAARVEHLGFEARPGPAWDEDAASVAARIQAARGLRGDDEWEAEEGCRTAAWRRSVGLEGLSECGRCEVCDPSGLALSEGLARSPGRLGLGTVSPEEAPRGKASLDALFAGLGKGTKGAAAPPPDLLLDVLRGGDPAALRAEVERVGGPSVALALALLRTQSAPVGAPLGSEAADVMLSVLAAGHAPWGELPAGVTSPRPGTWVLESPDLGKWTFVRRSGSGAEEAGFVARLQALPDSGPGEGVTRLAAARAAGGTWEDTLREVEAQLRSALAQGGLPDLAGLAERLHDARVVLEAAIGQPAKDLPELVRVLAIDPADTEAIAPYLAAFLGRNEPGLPPRVAARWVLEAEELPALSAAEVLRWVRRDRLGLDDGALSRLLSGMRSGRRADLAGLVESLGEAWTESLLEVGLRLGALPRELFERAITDAGPARAIQALVAVSPDAGRARRIWAEHRHALASHDVHALLAELASYEGAVAVALRAELEADLDRQEARLEEARAVVGLAGAGRLGEAAERMAALDTSDLPAALAEELSAVRSRAVARQSELIGPVASVLAGATGDEAEDEAFAAIEEAVGEGFGRAVVALLSKQHRRAPDDPARALWFARALCISGDWAEGERVYGVAASLRSDVGARVATEFEGMFLAFEEGESHRAIRWLRRVLEVPWHQVLLPHVQELAEEGIVPAAARREVAAALEQTGSPFYSKVIRALRQ
jgi:hypothetical protein